MWVVNFVLIDGKMRSLFSILFGASMLLVMERAQAAGQSPARAHIARMAALLMLGLVHFFAIWWGDILTLYALTGMLACLFWQLPARALLLLSAVLFLYTAVPAWARMQSSFAAYEQAASPGASGEAVSDWEARASAYRVTRRKIAADKAMHASPLAYTRATLETRAWEPIESFGHLWAETLALMLLGMAGFRSGFLTGSWNDRTYRWIAASGLAVGGVGFAVLGVWVLASDFHLPNVIAADFALSLPLRPVMAIGYAALIIMLFRRRSGFRERVAAVGRAAFTNYLGASIIGVAVFFDTGLGLYADVSRAEAWLLVPVIWAAMLAWSKPWLDCFQYGPLEWLWRSLARLEMQPMRKRSEASAAAVEA
jgi:uncharacterized protein